MDIITVYKRFNGESDEELIYRITGEKDQIGSWQDVADILNELLGTEYTESKFRKQRQAFDKMLAANQSKFADSDAQLKEIEVQKRELERKKIQFRDERNAWQKQNFTDARVEEKLDKLESELTSLGRTNFDEHNNVSINSDNDMLIILSDLHIGQTFDSIFGKYNTDIAKDRLNQLLNEVISIRELHNSKNCYVSLQGDLISGNIHKSIQVSNRENVIEQIKIATELISSFCYELSLHFETVFMSNVSGNHTRMDHKDDAIHDERLDDIISWAVELSLKHIDNFHVLHINIDTGISDILIRGKSYIAVHGDYDGFNKSGVQNLCLALGFVPYAITYGHLHVCSVDETNGVKMIRGGSLAGCGDSYTIEKRLTGKPSQMVCICTDKGVKAYYPIELK
ncbi:metallophosphoesterase family protein [Eubacterium ventriosum]